MNVIILKLKSELEALEKRREMIIAQMVELAYNDAYAEAKAKEEARIADMQERLAAIALQKKAAEKEAKIQAERKEAAKRIKDLEAALAKAEEEAAADFQKENDEFLAIADDAEKELDPQPEVEEPEVEEPEEKEA